MPPLKRDNLTGSSLADRARIWDELPETERHRHLGGRPHRILREATPL